MSWARVELIGARLLTAPKELRYTGSNKAVIDLFVGCGSQERPCAIEVTCWGGLAERVQEYEKGDTLAIVGRLGEDSWEDGNTGKKRTKHKVTASRVERMEDFSREAMDREVKRVEKEHEPAQASEPKQWAEGDEVPF